LNTSVPQLRRATDRPRILPIKARLRIYRTIGNLLATQSSQQLADSFNQMRAVVERDAFKLPDLGRLLKIPGFPRFDFSPLLARALRAWTVRLRTGDKLSVALEGWVPHIELSIIMAGESSNQLARAFDELMATVSVSDDMRNKLISALTYPVIVFAGAFAIITYLAATMVPEFRDFAPNQPRLAITHILLGYTSLIEHVPYVVIVLVIGAVVAFGLSFARWKGYGRAWADHHLPPYSIYRSVYGLAFMRAYDVLTRSGTQGGNALASISTNANPYLRSRIEAVATRFGPGARLGDAMDATGHGFPDKQMIESILLLPEDANFSNNLKYLIDTWQKDLVRTIETQTAALNTLCIIGIGIMIIAIYVGILDLVPVGDLSGPK
jgi:type II secretory pathway component PulF